MKKEFKFKLEGLLKFRKLKEKNIKIELGRINQGILNLKNEIIDSKKRIERSYALQEKSLANKTKSSLIEAFPYYIQSERENIKNKEILIDSLKKKYQGKINDMKMAMGETKIIDKIKEKKVREYKIKFEKKQREDTEEMVRMRSYYLKQEAK